MVPIWPRKPPEGYTSNVADADVGIDKICNVPPLKLTVAVDKLVLVTLGAATIVVEPRVNAVAVVSVGIVAELLTVTDGVVTAVDALIVPQERLVNLV